jgi:hypothetical protein
MACYGDSYFYFYLKAKERRGSTVGIATGYGLAERGVGVLVPVGSRILTSLYRPEIHHSS